jgi:hypothetical protein
MSDNATIDVPVETPDYLIGIGGNGSKLVERFMQREWIVDNEINPNVGNDVGKLHARTVDSADSERETERRTNAETEIQNLISDRVDAYDQIENEVDFEHYNYVENTQGTILTNDGLTSFRDVNDTLQDADRIGNNWWLADDRELIGTGGFGNGVDRRRAQSKALYHISATEGAGERTHPQDYNVTERDEVVIVVALGGGTGSGSFIEMAQDFPNGTNVHLFGIMPDSGYGGRDSESVDELASAYAALSELEYMQVNDESPFYSVALLPYNKSTESSHFEEAVIDTILSFLELNRAGNAGNLLIPEEHTNAIEGSFPFIVGVPRIIEFDAGLREEAQDSIDEYLHDRNEQLQTEEAFYKVVKNYIENDYEGSIKRNLNPDGVNDVEFNLDDDQQAKKAHAMKQRLEEKLQGDLLSDEVHSVAGVAADDILGNLEEQYQNANVELADTPEDQSPYERVETERDREYADDIVGQLPENIRDHLQAENFDGDREKQLASTVKREVKNISERRDLLRAIYATEPDEITGLDTSEGRKVKRALAEVVLDSDAQSLSAEFPQDGIETVKNSLGLELYENEIYYVQLEGFEEAVSNHYRDLLNDWWDDTSDAFGAIVSVDNHSDEIETAINALNEACDKKAKQLSSDTYDTDTMDKTLPRVDGERVDVQHLNKLLAEVGVEERVEQADIKDVISSLIQAKAAKEQYGGIEIWGSSNEEAENQFTIAYNEVVDSPYFKLENGDDITRAFSVSFSHDFSYLLDRVDERYEQAVDDVVGELKDRLTDEDGTIDTVSVSDMVAKEDVAEKLEESGTMSDPSAFLDDYGVVDMKIPKSPRSVESHIDSLDDEIRTLEADDEEDLDRAAIKRELAIDEIVEPHGRFDVDEIDPTKSSLMAILEAFLVPTNHELEERRETLEELGSTYIDGHDEGTFQALQRLVRLSNRRADSPTDEGLELAAPPDLNPSEVVYGPDFYAEYEDYYQVPSADRESTQEDSIYKKFVEAETRDLTGSPADIGESDIWDNRNSDEIIPRFRNSIRNLENRETARNPVDLSELRPRESKRDELGNEYGNLRILNAFMSRVFTEDEAAEGTGNVFDDVRELFEAGPLYNVSHEQNGYWASRLNYGNEWTVSMTTFISAVTLGMLEPAREVYKPVYEDEISGTDYPWRNHVVGLDGDWDSWPTLLDRVGTDDDWFPHGGAFLWRDELRPKELCELGIKARSDDWSDFTNSDTRDKINELIETDTFPSTLDIEDK